MVGAAGGCCPIGALTRLLQTGALKFSEAEALRFSSKVRSDGDCLVWTGAKHAKGYGHVRRGVRTEKAHRVVLMSSTPKPEDKNYACHSCDNPACVNPEHLWWGTNAENMADGVAKGRFNKGTTHPRSRLTGADVLEIKRLYAEGASTREIAKMFPIGHHGVWWIVAGKTWKHVQTEHN